MNKLLLGLIVFVCFSFCVSCGLFPPYDFEFKNSSAFQVEVIDLKDADVKSFSLPKGDKKSVSIDSTTIQFAYSPYNLVTADIDTDKKKVNFVDK